MNKPVLMMAAALVAASAGTAAQAQAMNDLPPLNPILDLNGGTIPHGAAQLYSVDFIAGQAVTAITFAFREDPAFISFSDVSLVDTSTGSGNLLVNGDFSQGAYTSNGNSLTPVDWTYANQYGAVAGGILEAGCGVSGSNCWFDGAVQAYDALSQTVATPVGDTYQLSFYATDDSNLTNWSDVSTNGNTTDEGGNGADILAYAQAGLPPPASATPEPATWALMFAGLAGIGLMLRRARRTMGFRFRDAFAS